MTVAEPEAAVRIPRVVATGTTLASYRAIVQMRRILMHLCWFAAVIGLFTPIVPFLGREWMRLTGFSPFALLAFPYSAHLGIGLSLAALILASHRNVQRIARVVAVYCALPLTLSFARRQGLYDPSDLVLVTFAFMLLSFALALLSGVISQGGLVRITLLRPFGQAEMTAALKRVIRNNLAPIGHIYTLSDRNFRPSIAMSLLAFIGQFRHIFAPIVRPSLREATVSDDLSYRDLVAALSPGFEAAAKSVYSGGQAFNIATSDAWWRRCITLMLNSSELVIMDISRIGAGSAWEVEQLHSSGMFPKCIFIAQQAHADASRRLAELLPAGSAPPVHVFDRGGDFLDPAAFQTALDVRLADAFA